MSTGRCPLLQIVTAFESDFKGQLSVYEAADPIRSAQCVGE